MTEKCRATFASFGVLEDVADLLVCGEPRGHVGIHMDHKARKAWKRFDVPPCAPPAPADQEGDQP